MDRDIPPARESDQPNDGARAGVLLGLSLTGIVRELAASKPRDHVLLCWHALITSALLALTAGYLVYSGLVGLKIF